MNKLTLPDLRFEETFMKSLYGYSGYRKSPQKSSPPRHLTDKELELVNEELDQQELDIIDKPLITPGIVAYAIIKDQIILPLIQGFLWTGFLISISPFLKLVVRQGQIAGQKLYAMMGLDNLRRGANRGIY